VEKRASSTVLVKIGLGSVEGLCGHGGGEEGKKERRKEGKKES